jgi:hypothetical protein
LNAAHAAVIARSAATKRSRRGDFGGLECRARGRHRAERSDEAISTRRFRRALNAAHAARHRAERSDEAMSTRRFRRALNAAHAARHREERSDEAISTRRRSASSR